MTVDAPVPWVDWDDAATVFDPPGAGEGHWVGAPSVCRHDGRTYLAARWRDPERRGYAVGIYERTGAGTYDELARITAGDLDVESVERPALLADPETGDARLYLPVDRGENDWMVRAFDDAPHPGAFDPATARTVLRPAAAGSDAVTVKDPCVVVAGGRYYMFYAGADDVSERAHLAHSDDGEAWTRSDANPVLDRAGWHDHHVRVTAVRRAPGGDGWVALYDGSGRDDHGRTWNLRTGVAAGPDLAGLRDATPDRPALAAPHASRDPGLDGFGACRYVEPCRLDGEDVLFAEVARSDGAFELVRAPVHWPA